MDVSNFPLIKYLRVLSVRFELAVTSQSALLHVRVVQKNKIMNIPLSQDSLVSKIRKKYAYENRD